MSIHLSHSERNEIAANCDELDCYMEALPEELEDTPEETVYEFIEGGVSVEDMIIELAEEMGLDDLIEEYEMEIAA